MTPSSTYPYELPPVELRKTTLGWQVRYRIFPRSLDGGVHTAWEWRSARRPTRSWATRVGQQRQNRSERRLDRQKGEGPFKWDKA